MQELQQQLTLGIKKENLIQDSSRIFLLIIGVCFCLRATILLLGYDAYSAQGFIHKSNIGNIESDLLSGILLLFLSQVNFIQKRLYNKYEEANFFIFLFSYICLNNIF